MEVHESQEEDPTVDEMYKLNDTVLIRYLIRNKSKYYIGFIEEVKDHKQTYFSINFLNL